jgi:hypothetical protein
MGRCAGWAAYSGLRRRQCAAAGAAQPRSCRYVGFDDLLAQGIDVARRLHGHGLSVSNTARHSALTAAASAATVSGATRANSAPFSRSSCCSLRKRR